MKQIKIVNNKHSNLKDLLKNLVLIKKEKSQKIQIKIKRNLHFIKMIIINKRKIKTTTNKNSKIKKIIRHIHLNNPQ